MFKYLSIVFICILLFFITHFLEISKHSFVFAQPPVKPAPAAIPKTCPPGQHMVVNVSPPCPPNEPRCVRSGVAFIPYCVPDTQVSTPAPAAIPKTCPPGQREQLVPECQPGQTVCPLKTGCVPL
jgi:hypothetical protein